MHKLGKVRQSRSTEEARWWGPCYGGLQRILGIRKQAHRDQMPWVKLGEAVDAVWLLGKPPAIHEGVCDFDWNKYIGGNAGVLAAITAYASDSNVKDLL